MDINDQSIDDILTVLDYLKDNTKKSTDTLYAIVTELRILNNKVDSKTDLLYEQYQHTSKLMHDELYDIKRHTGINSDKLESIDNTLHKFYLNTDSNLFKLLLAQKEGARTWADFQEFYEESQKIEIQQANKQEKQTASKFKALTSSVLTKKDFIDVEGRKSKREKLGLDYKPLTKYEKQNLKQQDMLNTKMGALLKDVQDGKKEKEGGGGIMRLLGPFVLLFGGIAALSYGMMKFPLVRRFFTDLKNSRIGTSIAGFIGKIKPHDKTIKEWLRGLPFIGNLFDIYDGFQQLFQGNIKQGIKHFAFAIPGAEWLANMIGSSKQQMLAPGGFQKAWQEFSLEKVWSNIKKYFNDTFIKPITSSYYSIRDAFSIMVGGSRGDITAGLMMLAEDFPSIAPVANFISKIAGKVFDVSLGELDIDKPSDWPKFDEQTIGGVFTKIYEGVSGFMSKIMDVFGQIGTFVGHFANVFSDDYGKQSAALNAIDEMSPSIGGMLRTVLGLVDNFKNAGIEEGDDAFTSIKKLTDAALKGSSQSKFGRAQTLGGEMGAITQQLEGLDEDKDKDQIKILEQRLELLGRQNIQLTNRKTIEEADRIIEGLEQRIQQPGSGTGGEGMLAAGLAGSALLAKIFPPAGAGAAVVTSGLYAGYKGTAAFSDWLKSDEYQADRDREVARKIQAQKSLYEDWMKYGRDAGEPVPEDILDIVKQDIAAGLLSPDVLIPKKATSQISTPSLISTPLVAAPKVSVPSTARLSPEQLMSEISKRFADQQSKLTENTKYLPELYLLLQRMYPDVAAIKDTNAGMLNQGPGNVTSLVQGGTTYTFGSRESGYMRPSLTPQWGTQ